ncbi:MAG: VOC family protein [Caldimonas sp.]
MIRFRTAFHVGEDLSSLVRFYTEGLGLSLKFRDDNRWAELRAGDTRFALSSPEEAPSGMRGGSVSVFEVTGLDSLLKQACQAGATLNHLREMGEHGRVATLLDPAGTLFQLLELKSET